MAVLLTQDLPVGRAELEAVSAEMGVHDNHPDGLILHTFIETPDGVHVVDVWESAAHYDRFRDDRLMPAIGKVMAGRGVAIEGPPPAPVISEAYDLIH